MHSTARWAVGSWTDAGTRPRNEDRALFERQDDGGALAIVCDGFGALPAPAGALLSESAAWMGLFELQRGSTPHDALQRAHEVADGIAQAGRLSNGGAAAFCLRAPADGKVEMAACGDVLALAFYENGSMSLFPARPRCDEAGNLTSYLGIPDERPFIAEGCFCEPADAIVVVTDGVWRFNTLNSIRDDITSEFGSWAPEAKGAARRIVQTARRNGSTDDATALVLLRTR